LEGGFGAGRSDSVTLGGPGELEQAALEGLSRRAAVVQARSSTLKAIVSVTCG
jgi:hypothetical protein